MKNLNNLNNEEIEKLEKYILSKINSKEVIIFFNELKNGKLKNRNVDVDALDFICDGLSDLVESWLQKQTQNEEINIRKLFDRRETKQFNVNVKSVLKQNGYSNRSKKLDFKNQLESNSKFIKDGYIYLLRGGRKGQLSGFYAYTFIKEKINLEEYIKSHQGVTLEQLAYQHQLKGKGNFISTTTNLAIAEQFATQYEDGSIYVMKIKKEDAYRIQSPIDKLQIDYFPGDNDKGEREYLIPDCIYPEEICEEFKCYEHRKIFNYLVNKIGLKLLPIDLGLPEISETTEEIKRFTDKMYSEYQKDFYPANNDEFKEKCMNILADDPELMNMLIEKFNETMGQVIDENNDSER